MSVLDKILDLEDFAFQNLQEARLHDDNGAECYYSGMLVAFTFCKHILGYVPPEDLEDDEHEL